MAYINLLDVIYPVGSCYFSTLSTSPAEIIGGTWTQLTGGMLGLAGSTGVADAGQDGGSSKISVAQIPAHWHDLIWDVNTSKHTYNANIIKYAGWGATFQGPADSTSSPSTQEAINGYGTTLTGGGQDYVPAHSSVYCWMRIA